ncbi:MAG TPA: hypothetical protein VHO91_11165, partial [Rhodopila sp.]|nr:hypothetical protein [Rhodopila sp.]
MSRSNPMVKSLYQLDNGRPAGNKEDAWQNECDGGQRHHHGQPGGPGLKSVQRLLPKFSRKDAQRVRH